MIRSVQRQKMDQKSLRGNMSIHDVMQDDQPNLIKQDKSFDPVEDQILTLGDHKICNIYCIRVKYQSKKVAHNKQH